MNSFIAVEDIEKKKKKLNKINCSENDLLLPCFCCYKNSFKKFTNEKKPEIVIKILKRIS